MSEFTILDVHLRLLTLWVIAFSIVKVLGYFLAAVYDIESVMYCRIATAIAAVTATVATVSTLLI